MPLTAKGTELKSALTKEYGEEKGERVLYAGKNKGTFTGIDTAEIDAACRVLEDEIEGLNRRVDAYCDARTDAQREPEHKVVMEFDGDFNITGLLQHLHRLGAIGASRTVIAEDENEKAVKFGWDGDGADKIRSCTVDGVDILK